MIIWQLLKDPYTDPDIKDSLLQSPGTPSGHPWCTSRT